MTSTQTDTTALYASVAAVETALTSTPQTLDAIARKAQRSTDSARIALRWLARHDRVTVMAGSGRTKYFNGKA